MTINSRPISNNHNSSKGVMNDLISSFFNWRIFCMLGVNDVKKRYSRSKIGQFWLTLSLAINIAVMGIVWAYLFKIPVREYLPFLATGIIIWSYIAANVSEGTTVYVSSSSYLQAINLPKLTYINSQFVRNIITLLHNVVVLVPVYLFCSVNVPLENIGLSILGFVLTSIFLYPLIMLFSLIGLRFRDFPNIMGSLMQIIYYLTPIMWKVSLMPEKFQKYLILNPFAVFLTLCRNPLFSSDIPSTYWLASVIYIILAWLVAVPFFSRFNSRITYWL